MPSSLCRACACTCVRVSLRVCECVLFVHVLYCHNGIGRHCKIVTRRETDDVLRYREYGPASRGTGVSSRQYSDPNLVGGTICLPEGLGIASPTSTLGWLMSISHYL
eukprot:362555-Chlamydomonas_euryale.AAC.14